LNTSKSRGSDQRISPRRPTKRTYSSRFRIRSSSSQYIPSSRLTMLMWPSPAFAADRRCERGRQVVKRRVPRTPPSLTDRLPRSAALADDTRGERREAVNAALRRCLLDPAPVVVVRVPIVAARSAHAALFLWSFGIG